MKAQGIIIDDIISGSWRSSIGTGGTFQIKRSGKLSEQTVLPKNLIDKSIRNPLHSIKHIWNDPVWSKVIAAGIIFVISTIAGYFWFSKNNVKRPANVFAPSIYNADQNDANLNNNANNSISINRSKNVSIIQTPNVQRNMAINDRFRLKEALRSLDSIKSHVEISIELEPDEYRSLLSRVRGDIRNIKNVKGKVHDLIISTYDCYHEAGEIWQDGCPSTLLNKRLLSVYDDAKKQFQTETLPRLYNKWKGCSASLKKSYEYFEME